MASNQLQFRIETAAFETHLRISWNSYGMLKGIEWIENPDAPGMNGDPNMLSWAPAPMLELVNRLKEYFRTGRPLGTLPWEWIDQSSWTPFQYQVYSWIAKIPHGETRTYGWVATRIGNSCATRAVGQALKKNPMPIFIPCHRVVAVDSLGGFMGASDPKEPELKLKRRLLNLEQSYLNPPFAFMPAVPVPASAG
jgi:methylated-DNA-[protein]-cysteine S-methyltransferase